MLPIWRLHRHVGMGGDKLVAAAAVAGDGVEERLGDELRERAVPVFDSLEALRERLRETPLAA